MTKKRKGEEEVLEVSNLMKAEFGSAVSTRQHCQEQEVHLARTVEGLGTTAQFKLSKAKWRMKFPA